MATPNATPPEFHELDDAAARRFLAAHHVGRIAFTFRDRVDIAPIHYVADGDWIYARTSEGAKLTTLRHHPWCAFEADEVHGLFDWTSVVVKGQLTLLQDRPPTVEARKRGLVLLRDLVPGTFTDADPVPERMVLVRIHVSEITGRRARSGPPAGKP